MGSTLKYKIIRYIGYTVELLVFFVLQETPGFIPAVFGARPVLVVPAVIAIAMFENEIPAMLFGLFGGLLMDFGFSGILGYHGMLLAVCCYVVSLIATNLLQTNFITTMLISLVCIAAVTVLQWLFFYVLYGYGSVLYALIYHYLPIFAYTMLLMPIAYYFNRALALQIRSKEE
jgi:rod shape-determining protein MreD